MHIPDAVLDPRTAALTGAIALGGLAIGVSRVRSGLGDRTTVLMGVASACLFAAQMVNFPILVLPISGHLLGGVLAAVLLGPWAGACVIACVLGVQCLLCGDGGLTALGANFVNMGLIGSVIGYAIYDPIRRAIGGNRGVVIGAMAAAWFSVILASGAFAVELAASGTGGRASFLGVLGWMVLIHAAIGLGEAIITGLVVRFVLSVRPDLIYDDEPARLAGPAGRWTRVGVAGLGVALAVSLFLAPLASEHPDGLEAVGARFNFPPERSPDDSAPGLIQAPLPDYTMPGLERSKALATAAAGAVGTLVVFAVGLGLARASKAGRSVTPDGRGPFPDAA